MFTSAQHVATDLLLAVLLVGSFCIYVNGSSFVIDDDRVKTLDISPALGRGYSVKTNQFHSICLNVDETTEPSYNYEYTFTDVSAALEVNSSTKVSAKAKSSFGWGRVKASAEVNVDANLTVKSHIMMTTMRIDRYYASVMENKAPLSEDAKTLLGRKDYVGFYKACGPNYVRSIRRAQEVTAMFTIVSTDSDVISEMEVDIKAATHGGKRRNRGGRSGELSIDSSLSVKTSLTVLRIEIFGYGLGLDKDGSETLVATSLEDYAAAMKFAFSSMTRGNQGSAQTGMVYGIELVPWTDNTAFQVASDVHEIAKTNPVWTVPNDMIPNALPDGTCKLGGNIPDSYLKCCKEGDMQKFEVEEPPSQAPSGDPIEAPSGDPIEAPSGDPIEATSDGPSQALDTTKTKYCQPKRRFPVDLLKQNLQRNGEHVAMMDSILHHKTFTIMTLERCIQVLNSFPDSEKNTYLETRYFVTNLEKGDKRKTNNLVTVGDLKQFLNPNGDMASVDLLTMELDEYVDMYYNPCMAALFGMNSDVLLSADDADTGDLSEPGDMLDYFMMKQWNSHPECAYASCVIPTNSWNNQEGGCAPSFGQSPEDQGIAVLDHCAKELELKTRNLKCKRDIKAQVAKLDTCWMESTPFVLIERYCTPRLSDRERPTEPEVPKDNKIIKKCATSTPPTG